MNLRCSVLRFLTFFFLLAGSLATLGSIFDRLAKWGMQAHGLKAEAQVTKKFEAPRVKKQQDPTYWIGVKFVTKEGLSVQRNVQVTKAAFEEQQIPASATTTVVYLDDPPTRIIIKGADLPPQSLVTGPFVLLLGLFVGSFWLQCKASKPINTPATS